MQTHLRFWWVELFSKTSHWVKTARGPRWGLIVCALTCNAGFPVLVRAQVSELSVKQLIESLESDDLDKRRDAAYELTSREAHERAAIVAMAKALSDSDNQVRFQCLLALARAGEDSEPAIDQLIKLLSDRDDQVRFRAADALGKIGPAAVPKLVDAWSRFSNSAAKEAARAAAAIGPAAIQLLPLLEKALDGPSEDLGGICAEAIVAIIPTDQAAMIDIAGRKFAAVRAVGVTALGNLQHPSATATEKLKAAIADSAPAVREAAFVALAKSVLPADEKASFVRKALRDDSSSMRTVAVVVLKRAGLATPEFAKSLAQDLRIAHSEELNSIVRALGAIGSVAAPVLPELLVVADHDAVDRDLLAHTIANFGSTCIPALLDAIQADPKLERVAAQALSQIGEPAVSPLMKGLSSSSEIARLVSVRGLGSMPNLNPSAIDRLSLCLGDELASVRTATAETLVAGKLRTPELDERLLQSMSDPDAAVRAAAILAIPAMAAERKSDCTQAIDRALDDSSEQVRINALVALGQLPKSLLPESLSSRLATVLKLAQDDAVLVRCEAIRVLAALKGSAQPEPIIDALVAALADENELVRTHATTTVATLELTDERILTALSQNLTDNMDLLRATLTTVVGFGHRAEGLSSTVAKLVGHQQVDIRASAIDALTAIQPDKTQLVQQLIEALDDADAEVRRVSAQHLGELGADAQAAVPKLFSMLKSEQDSDIASGALREIDAAPIEAIPLLIESLGSEDRRVNFYSVSLLGKIGPPAREALPQLEKLLEASSSSGRSSDFRRRFVVEAIAAIKGQ